MALRSLRACSSNLPEWQTKVHQLWSFRKQHWECFRKGKANVPPSVPPACYAARSASYCWAADTVDVKLPYQLKPKAPSGLISSAREARSTCSPLSSARSLLKRPSSSYLNSARPQSRSTTALHTSSQSQSKPSIPFYKPSAWRDEIAPVPLGLATQTQSQLLVDLVSRGSGAFLEQLHRPHKGYQNPEPLKLSPRLSGFGSSRLFPASQAALEERIKKEGLKHRTPISLPNVAFGRSNYASFISRNPERSPRKSVSQGTQGRPSTNEATSACFGAKRDVINRIQDYHINAEARAQLTKRADVAEQERRLSQSLRERRVSVSQEERRASVLQQGRRASLSARSSRRESFA